MVGPRRRNSPVLRGVNKRGPVAARVLHVLTTQRASPTRRAVTNDALQESRREPPENSVSLTGGPRAPHLEARVIHHLSGVPSAGHVGLLCIYLEVRPVAHRLTPAPRPQFHAHPSLRGGEMTVEGSVFTGKYRAALHGARKDDRCKFCQTASEASGFSAANLL